MSVWDRLLSSGFDDADRDAGVLLDPPSSASSEDRHQFVVLLKPELLDPAPPIDVAAVVELVTSRMNREGLLLGGLRWFTGDELRRSRVMERHYGVINEVSRRGLDALSAAQRTRFNEVFVDIDDSQVFGGHAFLDMSPSTTAADLQSAFSSSQVVKIAPGIYAAASTFANDEVVLLNGFHPAQLEHFTSPTARMVALEYRSDRPWAFLRRQLVGATDPATAAPGSLRNEFFELQEKLNLNISMNSNGVHLSAGPIEGCAEVIRFFGNDDHEVPAGSTVLGAELTQTGVPAGFIEAVLNNTLTYAGESVFDATEEMDIDAAIQLLVDRPSDQQG